ncbi:MAG: hypothetical protein WBG38_16670 [Nodosilinea sp.]
MTSRPKTEADFQAALGDIELLFDTVPDAAELIESEVIDAPGEIAEAAGRPRERVGNEVTPVEP